MQRFFQPFVMRVSARSYTRPSYQSLSSYPVSLEYYSQKLPNAYSILQQLQRQNHFKTVKPVLLTASEALTTIFPNVSEALRIPFHRLFDDTSAVTLPRGNTQVEQHDLPEKFKPLTAAINLYLAKLCAVQTNAHATRAHENPSIVSSDVSEELHRAQAALIAYRLGLTLPDILALQFHHISRYTNRDLEDPHRVDRESGTILRPLGAIGTYSTYHCFAKYLLFQHSSLYPHYESNLDLPLPPSIFAAATEFSQLDDKAFALRLYKLMFMCVIDEASKRHPSTIRKIAVPFVDPDMIKHALVTCIVQHLHNNRYASPLFVQQFSQDMVFAISLLERVDHLQPETDVSLRMLFRR